MIWPIENSVDQVLNVKLSILKKINVSFNIHFCLSKYSFSFDTFSTHYVF